MGHHMLLHNWWDPVHLFWTSTVLQLSREDSIFLLEILKVFTSLHSLPSELWHLLMEDIKRDPTFRSKDSSFFDFSAFFLSSGQKLQESWSFLKQFSLFVECFFVERLRSCFLLSCSLFFWLFSPLLCNECWIIDQFSIYLCVNLWLTISYEAPYFCRHLTFNIIDLYLLWLQKSSISFLNNWEGEQFWRTSRAWFILPYVKLLK